MTSRRRRRRSRSCAPRRSGWPTRSRRSCTVPPRPSRPRPPPPHSSAVATCIALSASTLAAALSEAGSASAKRDDLPVGRRPLRRGRPGQEQGGGPPDRLGGRGLPQQRPDRGPRPGAHRERPARRLVAGAAPRQEELRRRRGRLTSMTRWLDGLEERARQTVPPHVLEYVLQGAGASRHRVGGGGGLGRGPTRAARAARRDPGRPDGAAAGSRPTGCPGAWRRRPCRARSTRTANGRWRAPARRRSPLVVSSNAGTPFAEIGSTGVGWWLQVYLPRNRELAVPLLARAVAAGARPWS